MFRLSRLFVFGVLTSVLAGGFAFYYFGFSSVNQDKTWQQLQSLAEKDSLYLDKDKVLGSNLNYEVYTTVLTDDGSYSVAQISDGSISNDHFVGSATFQMPDGELISSDNPGYFPSFTLGDGDETQASVLDNAITVLQLKSGEYLPLKIIKGEIKGGRLVSGIVEARTIDTGYLVYAAVQGGKITEGYITPTSSYVSGTTRISSYIALRETELRHQSLTETTNSKRVLGASTTTNTKAQVSVFNFDNSAFVVNPKTGAYQAVGGVSSSGVPSNPSVVNQVNQVISQNSSAQLVNSTNQSSPANSITQTNIITPQTTLLSLGPNSITSQMIQNLAVTTGDLADLAVTTGKIANGAITADKLASGVIPTSITTTTNIPDYSITPSKFIPQLTFSPNQLLDLSNISYNSAGPQGLRLPMTGTNPMNPSFGKGYVAYDAINNQVIQFNGSSWQPVGGGSTLGLSTSNYSSNTSSNSGLELASNQLSLLRGCGNGEILKWNSASKLWQCSTDAGSSGSGIGTVQENDATVVSSANTLDLLGSDFNVSEGPTGEANVSIDYTNSNIVRSNQTQSITGTWSFPNGLTLGTDSITDINGSGLSLVAGVLKVSGLTTTNFASPNISQFTNNSNYLTTTGSAAALTSFPTLNQNTTGTASNITGVLGATSFPSLTGDVTTTQGSLATTIGAGKVTNTNLVNSSITIAPGTGMIGGGVVSLGGSTTLGLASNNISQFTNDSSYITGLSWGQITGTLANQTDLQTALNAKANSSSLGTISTQNANAVNITGGTISGLTSLSATNFSGSSSGTNTGDNAVNSNYSSDYRAANFVAGTNYLAPNGSAASLTSFPTFNQNTTGTSSNITGVLGATSFPAQTGDVTNTQGSLANTISSGAVTLSKMANLSANSIIGNNTGSPATPIALTSTQVKSLLSIANTDVSGLGTLSTQNASGITVTGGTVAGLTGFGIRSSGTGAFDLTINNTEDLTAGRTLTITTGDAARTLTLTGNSSITGTNTGDNATNSQYSSDYRAANFVAGTNYLAPNGSAASLTSFPTLNQNTTGTSSNITGVLGASSFPAMTGDVTNTQGSLSTAISSGAVSLGKMANLAANSIIGNNTGISATPIALTAAQVKSLLAIANTDVSGLGTLSTQNSNNISVTGGSLSGLTSVAATTFTGALTGNASTATTLQNPRTIAGTSFNGGSNITLANKFVVQGTADTGLSGPQFLGALGTGIVKNTTTTGVLSIAVAGDFPTLNQSTTGTASNITGVLGASSFPALTGDVTTVQGALGTTIANGAVTLGKQANLAANSIIGNNTGSSATPIALTATQVKSLLSIANTDVSGLGTLSTQNASGIAVTGGTVAGLTGFGIRSSGTGAFDLTINNTENLTAGRTLTIVTGDAARSLTLTGNASITGTNTGDNSANTTYANDFRAANFVAGTNYLAPNGSAASLTSFPTFNQNTTGTASNITGVLGAGSFPAQTGDVANTQGSLANAISSGAVTLGKMANLAANSIIGNNTGISATPIALTAAQVKTLLAIANTDVSGLGTMSTQNASGVAITGGTASGLTGLGIRSSGTGAFDLTIANSENLTAGRTLTITTGNAARVLTLTGDASITGTNTGDNATNSQYSSDYRAANFIAGTNYLAPNGSAAALTSFPTLNQSTTGNALTATTATTGNALANTDAAGQSAITAINSASVGTINTARLNSSVTTQGNSFNGVSQLVQLNSSGNLPVLNGAALTGITGDQVLPAQTGNNGKVLGTNGTTVSWITNSSNVAWGAITGTLSNQTDLQNALNLKANSSSLGTLSSQNSSAISVTGGTLAGLTGLGVRSSGTGAFDLTIANSENLTAGRTLTITTGDAARTLTLTGNASITGTNTGDNSANSTYASDYRAANFIAGTNYLAPNGSAASLTSFPTLNQNTTGTASNITGVLGASSFPAMTGDVTNTQGSLSTAISSGAVTLGKMANLSANSIIGNNTGSSAAPVALSISQVKTLLAIANTDVSGLGTLSTQNASGVAITGGTAAGLTGLGIRSSGTGAFDLTIANSENLTAGRTLTIVTGDAARSLTLTGNASITGTNTGDNSANSTYASDYRAANFVAGTNYLAPNGSAASLTSFPTLNQNTTGTASNITGVLGASSFPALTGDVTTTQGALGTTIANGAVTLAKQANLAANSIIGNNTGISATPIALTAAQVKTLLAIANTDVSGLGTMSTQNASGVAITGGTAAGLTGLGIRSSGTGAFDLTIANSENLTAGRTLTITTGNAARTLTLTGDASITGTNTGDNSANSTYASDYRAANFIAGTNYLAPNGSAASLTSFPTLNQNTTGTASNITGVLGASSFPAQTGDVTNTQGSLSNAIASGAVSLAKMSNLAANSIIGNNTGISATPIALTAAQVKTLLAIATGDVSGLGTIATQASNNVALTGGTINGITIGGSTAGAGTFTTLTANTSITRGTDTITDFTGNGLTLSTGALTIAVPAAADALSSTTSSGSGLEVLSGGVTLLQGCSDGQILKWNETTDVWACQADNGGAGGGVATIKEGASSIVTSATAMNFAANDFAITDETGGQAGIAIDYTNSHITRDNQTQTISGAWTYSTAATFGAANSVTLGTSSSVNGAVVFKNSTNTNTATLQSGATGTSYTWTLPTADSAGCLQSNGAGTLSLATCGDIKQQVITSTGAGTYTKPAGAIMVIVEAVGAGGGGGGGASNTGAVVRMGGAGGGGGAYNTKTYSAADLGATESYSVGVGGTLGTAGASGAIGGNGGIGGATTFGTTIMLTAGGGGGGRGGAITAVAGGGGGGGGTSGSGTSGTTAVGAGGNPSGGTTNAVGGQGGTGSITATAGVPAEFGGGGGGGHTSTPANSAGGTSLHGGGGGGVGGGATVTPTLVNATAGGQSGTYTTSGGGGGTAGTSGASPTVGGPGAVGASSVRAGAGGGGGGGTITASTAGAAGGNGGAPGGGAGGGGVGSNTAAGGAGGTGGRGELRIWTIKGTGADLAEIYGTKDDTIGPGDVVALDATLNAGVKKTEKAYDQNVFGVISTSPSLVMGSLEDANATPVMVALSGRVPIKVSMENGPIKAGDLLTPSSTPGVAMKATKAGQIIGQAMIGFEGIKGTDSENFGLILAFIKNSTSNGQTLNNFIAGLASTDATPSASVTGNDSAALLQLVSQKDQLAASSNLSEISTDRLTAGLEIITPKLLADEINVRDLTTGGLKVNGSTMFLGNVEFTFTPLFNNDTAGFAVVNQGDGEVNVTFANEYAFVPVVVATPDQPVLFSVINNSTKGFTIKTNNASSNVKFNWIAFAVRDARTVLSASTSVPTATPSAILMPTVSPSATPSDSPTATPEASSTPIAEPFAFPFTASPSASPVPTEIPIPSPSATP